MTYDYDTPHIRWEITGRADGIAELYRFNKGNNPPFGGWMEFVSDHDSTLEAERRADETECTGYPESDEIEPIPLVHDPLPEPLKKVA